MKWSIVGLLALGVVAAASAALLVSTLTARNRTGPLARPPERPDEQVELLVASRPLEAMSIVQSNDLTARPTPRESVPADSLTSAVQVVGRVLAMPMAKDQPFTRPCFALAGPGVHVAATLPQGKRAVSVSLADYSGLEGLLYPGSVVDVLVAMRAPSEGRADEAISTVLLGGVQVLAVEHRTIVDPDNNSGGKVQDGRRTTVTLMVDTEQAKALQLALRHGTILLAMRNPRDGAPVDKSVVALSDLAEGYAAGSRLTEQLAASVPAAPPSEPAAGAEEMRANSSPPWQTMIIRGCQVETRTFKEEAAELPERVQPSPAGSTASGESKVQP